MTAFISAAMAALVFLSQGGATQGVEKQVVVRPDTVTVGSPFDVVVRVSAPKGSTIRFPAGPDSSGAVRMLDPVVITTQDTVGNVVQTAVYRVAAWQINMQPIDVGDIVVANADGLQRVAVAAPPVMVRSVLPLDSNARVPKPARDLFGVAPPWWYPWLPLVVLALLLIAIFRWWYRRRGPRIIVSGAGALEESENEFRRIEAMQLVEAGERGRHVVLMVDALRDFLAARFARTTVAQTSAELLAAIDSEKDLVPIDRVALLLRNADEVKFAQRSISAAAAIKLGREATEIARAIGNPKAVPIDQEDAA